MMKISCIYIIKSVRFADRFYIGSAVNFNDRRGQHKRLLDRGVHKNRKLQNHFNKYGSADFVFEIIELVHREDLIQREQHYIDTMKPKFNINKKAGNQLGYKHTDNAKKNMSRAAKGKILSEVTKQKIRSYRHSEDAKRRIRDSLIDNKRAKGGKGPVGVKRSAETIDKIRVATTGVKASKATREKMRVSQIKRWSELKNRAA
jgi:group I intron endonuclease